MKKILSIIFASVIILSGMHFTVSTHYCGGKISSSKISVTGNVASCGMEESSEQCILPGKHLSSNCCKNKISVFAVENNYTSSFSEFKVYSQTLLHVFLVPVDIQQNLESSVDLISANVSPPGNFQVSSVSLPRICVFRI